MSVLRSRIMSGNVMVTHHPDVGQLPATPRVLPLAQVHYEPFAGFYNEVWWQPPATGDVNAVPIAATNRSGFGAVVPAGRP